MILNVYQLFMRINSRQSVLFLLLFFSIVVSSCSSGKSFADRKREKYNKDRYAHVDKRKRTTRVKKSTRTKTKPRRAEAPKYSTKVGHNSAIRDAIVTSAKKHLGLRYVYGGKSTKGFDCSGFTSYVYQQNGINLSGASYHQAKKGLHIDKQSLKRGDLIFFGKGKVSHVGIVVSNTGGALEVIHATSSRGVVLENISDSSYWQGRLLYGRDILSQNVASM